MNTAKYIAAALLMTAAAAGWGATPLDATQAVLAVLDKSPSLKGLQVDNSAQTLEIQDAARFNNQPEVEFERLWGRNDKRWNLSVSQGFDWPGVYKKRRQASRTRIDAFTYLYEASRQNLALQAKLAYAQGVYAQKRIDLVQGLLDNLAKLDTLIQIGYERGQLTVLDVRKSRYERYSVSTQMTDLQAELTDARTALDGMAGEILDYSFDAYGPQPILTMDEYLVQIDGTPELQAMRQLADADLADASVAKAERLPSFSLGYVHAYEDQEHFNGLSVGVTLPVFATKNSERAASMRAQNGLATAQAEEDKIVLETVGLYKKVKDRQKYLAEMHAVVLDESYPELLMMAYRGGKLNVITYLQEMNYFMQARLDYLSTEYQYITDLIRLNGYTL